MSSFVNAQVRGLAFGNNVYSAAPAGSLAVAQDCVVNAAGLLEPRRGFAPAADTFGTSVQRARSLGFLSTGKWLVSFGDSGELGYYSGSTFTDFAGAYLAVNDAVARMRFEGAALNVYFNTDAGTFCISSAFATPAEAGVPKGLDIIESGVADTSKGTWFTYDTAVAYRYLFSITDAAGNYKPGAPSGRGVVRNRILIAATSLVRAGNVVTGTYSSGEQNHLAIGEVVVLFPGEATFPAGSKTVTAITATTFSYAEVAANAVSTVAQDFQISRAAGFLAVLPAGVTTSHFLEVFRSEMTAAAADEPSDELFKVLEVKLTAAHLLAGYVVVYDSQPESLLGDPLYTNPSQEGLGQANERPPIGLDLEWWQGRLWLGNTVSRHRFELDLLGVSAPDGLQNDWTITIAGVTYTAKAAPGAAPQFKRFTALATPALNTEATARALIVAINTVSTLVRAYYISGPDDVLARILLEEIAIGGASFALTATTSAAALAACWNPALPISGTTASSDNNTMPNGLSYSKLEQPEAWPLLNCLPVGPKNSNLLRHTGLRDRQYAWTEDGLYTVSGQEPFSTEKLAETRLYAADTVVLLGEAVWALTDQGVVRVTETGVNVVSRDIEPALTALFGAALDTVRELAFAVAHESARMLVLYLPTSATSTKCEQAYVYNTATQAWTGPWTLSATCGLHDGPSDVLILGDGAANRLLFQRNNRTDSDYRDPEFAATLASSSGKVLQLSSTVGITAGDRIVQGVADELVASVDSATQLTLRSTATWSPGAVTVFPAIPARAVFNPVTAGHPALGKSFRDMSVMFQQASLTAAVVESSTDLAPAVVSTPLAFDSYGFGAWGSFPWGNPTKALQRIFPLPNGQCAQLTVGLRVREAAAFWQLAGFTVEYEGGPGKLSR